MKKVAVAAIKKVVVVVKVTAAAVMKEVAVMKVAVMKQQWRGDM